MNKHFFKAAILSLSLIFATVGPANAARLGGGKSFGKAPSAPIQKQAALTGQQHHIVVPVAVSLGQVSPHQGSRQTAPVIGS